jgi:hypothetical protein
LNGSAETPTRDRWSGRGPRMPRPDLAEATGAEALLTVWAFGGLSDPSLGTSWIGRRAARSFPERRPAIRRALFTWPKVADPRIQHRPRAGRRSYCGNLGGSAFGLTGFLLLSRSASACCAFLKASYSGVPGLGGTSFGAPPNHVGASLQPCPRTHWCMNPGRCWLSVVQSDAPCRERDPR